MARRIELILFDIDGTLLQSHKVTRYGMSIALKEVFGRYGPIDQYSMSGKTNQQIMRELMLLDGISSDEINEKLPQACHLYVNIVCESIAQFYLHPCVGIPELLRTLQEQKHLTLGLLTGNLEGIVEAKLSQAGLRKNIFSLGAFGSDAEDREVEPLFVEALNVRVISLVVHTQPHTLTSCYLNYLSTLTSVELLPTIYDNHYRLSQTHPPARMKDVP